MLTKPTKRVAIVVLALALILCAVLIIITILPSSTRERYENNDELFWTYWEPTNPPSVVQRCYANWKSVGGLEKYNF